jgi:translation initiation factor 2D
MVPGVPSASIATLSTAREGALYAVYVPGNPCAVAVGSLAMSGAQLAASGGRGRLLEVVHVYRDSLWALGEKEEQLPNEGFLPDRVISIIAPAAGDAGEFDVEDTVSVLSTLTIGADESDVAPPPAEAPQQPAAVDMDALLDTCLLQALRTRVKDKDLPLACGALLTTHLLPSRPAGTHVDLKQSSYKKLSKFLQAKAADGLLTLREDKRTGDLLITGVNRRHPMLAGHARHTAESECNNSVATSTSADVLVCEEWLTPAGGASVKPLFVALQADVDALYTPESATAVLDSYIQREGLDAKGSTAQRVALDPLLWNAIFPRNKANISADGKNDVTELLRHELVALFLAACGRVHVVQRGDVSVKRKGELPAVRLRYENRGGGKRVTVIAGLEAFMVDAHELAMQLKERCASSAAVVDLPRPGTLAAKAPPPREVVVQGEFAAVVAHHLISAWGIPKALVPLPAGVKPQK